MTPLDILREARALITPPERWTQGYFALDDDGRAVHPGDPAAVCFCANGAARRVAGDPTFESPLEQRQALSRAAEFMYEASSLFGSGGVGVVYVNDILGHAATLQMFDLAIAKASA